MSEENLSDLLERSADRHKVGSPPLDQMLSRSRRARKRRAGFMALAASVVVATVIAGTTWLFNPSDSASPADSPTGGVINLEGDWRVTALFTDDSRPDEDLQVGDTTVQFDNGSAKVSGYMCGDNLVARYMQSGDPAGDLRFIETRSFEVTGTIGCPSGKLLYRRLLEVRTISESEGLLSLLAEDRSIIATLERFSTEPINLEGEWVLTALTDADGSGLIQGGPEPADRRMQVIIADGRFTATANCVEVTASYNQSRKGVTFADLRDRLINGADCVARLPLTTRLADVRHASEADGKLQLHAEDWMIVAVLEPADATEQVSALPKIIHVTCSAAGVRIDEREVQTRPNGVVLSVKNDLPDDPAYSLTYYSSGKGGTGGGGVLMPGTSTYTMQLAPGVVTIGCSDSGDPIGGSDAKVRVSDPGAYWRGFDAVEGLGCPATSGLNDWRGDFFQTATTAEQAAQAVADVFSEFEADRGRAGKFAVREMATGYIADRSQVWLTDKDGIPHATIQVTRGDTDYRAGALSLCQ